MFSRRDDFTYRFHIYKFSSRLLISNNLIILNLLNIIKTHFINNIYEVLLDSYKNVFDIIFNIYFI